MERVQCTKKRRDYAKGARALAFVVLLLGVLAAAPGVWAEEANGKDIYLQPGDAYDADGAGNNTTVYMDQAGTYTLMGNSDNIRIIIKTGGVTVYLEDGLHIDPGAYADNGKSASAISVQHTSGDVRLVSKAGASIYFGSHYRAPAIHQDGTDGTLIFATEDSGNPGTITAKSAKLGESAAIGSGRDKGTTGNIVFESGNVNATGDDYAAAIGGGNGGRARNITINGGSVEAQGGMYAAGIGGGMYEGAAYITVNGGEVIAKGGKGGAGIGSGLEIDIDPIKGEQIKITGGEVEALGGTGAAGIGGGRNADGEHIEITGGTVVAKGGDLGGAGIGGGGWFDAGGYGETSLIGGDGRYITISGGNVTAIGGENGAGIGGGNEEGNGENITISGGTVAASGGGGGAGIGGAWKGRAKDITITGGKVTANGAGGGAGIGGGSMAWGRNLKISGGIVRANGGDHGDGIGGGKKPGIFSKDFTNSVFISGGTVVAKKGGSGSADIGGRGDSAVSITGGSVWAVNNAVKNQPKNQAGDTVYRTTVTFYHGPHGENKIDSLQFASNTPTYGTNDIYNVSNIECDVCLWLPKKSGVGVDAGVLTETQGSGASETTTITKKYTALEIEDQTVNPWKMKQKTIAPGTTGTMYGPNEITLDNGRNANMNAGVLNGINTDGLKDGSATGEFMETKLGNFVSVSGTIPGMHIEGYSTSNISDEVIADAEGNLVYNDLIPEYVNANNQWITASSPVTLYAVWAVNTYNIHFDSNKPAEASSAVEGNMADQTELSSQGSEELKANTYTLPGWRFSHWNTKPDGTGTTYADQGKIQENVGHDETVTLYAQWEPELTYDLTFEPGNGTGNQHTQTGILYDTPTKLDSLSSMGFTAPNGEAFLGWSTSALGHLYQDGETVINLFIEDVTGKIITGYTLTAQWGQINEEIVVVKKDGELTDIGDLGLDGGWNCLLLQKKEKPDGTLFKMEQYGTGVYSIANLPANETNPAEQANKPSSGQYRILLGRTDASNAIAATEDTGRTIEVNEGQLNIEGLDYCTVEMKMEPGKENDGNVWLEDRKGDQQEPVLKGDTIRINCDVTAAGQHFVKYTVTGHTPTWQTGCDETDPDQTITVTGRTCITACIESLQRTQYNIHYDSNGADSGVQLQDHHSFYDSMTTLYSAKQLNFGMPNYHFTSWNTKSGGDGIAYTAGQQVSNLAKGGESITLYAQWAHDSYTVHYDANGGTGTMLDEEFWTDAYEPLHQAVFKKDGCTFAGWNTRRDGTGTSYADREEVMNLARAGGSITLYAQWSGGGSDGSASDGSSDTGDAGFPWIPAVLLACSLSGIAAATLIRRKTVR